MTTDCNNCGNENAYFTLHDAETGLNWYECPDCGNEFSS